MAVQTTFSFSWRLKVTRQDTSWEDLKLTHFLFSSGFLEELEQAFSSQMEVWNSSFDELTDSLISFCLLLETLSSLLTLIQYFESSFVLSQEALHGCAILLFPESNKMNGKSMASTKVLDLQDTALLEYCKNWNRGLGH